VTPALRLAAHVCRKYEFLGSIAAIMAKIWLLSCARIFAHTRDDFSRKKGFPLLQQLVQYRTWPEVANH